MAFCGRAARDEERSADGVRARPEESCAARGLAESGRRVQPASCADDGGSSEGSRRDAERTRRCEGDKRGSMDDPAKLLSILLAAR